MFFGGEKKSEEKIEISHEDNDWGIEVVCEDKSPPSVGEEEALNKDLPEGIEFSLPVRFNYFVFGKLFLI